MLTLFNAAVLLTFATAAAWSDIRHRRVSNRLNLVILVAGLGWRAAEGGWSPILGLAGAVTGLALLIIPFHARWIGAGDVKLTAAFGAWLGPTGILWSTLAGLVGGGLLSLVLVAVGGAALRRSVADNLATAALSRSVPSAPRRIASATVPMAVPLGISAAAVFAITRGVF